MIEPIVIGGGGGINEYVAGYEAVKLIYFYTNRVHEIKQTLS